jgi:aminoglycoside phosphotransferase (APT) family kinase protein
VLLAHKPGPEVLATITPANYQTLKILQTHEHLAERLEHLRKGWKAETLIHSDIKSDNVLVIPEAASPPALDVRIVDWETAQIGDPAWDLAGMLQDFMMFWVFSIPVSPGLTPAEMAARARYPLGDIRPAIGAAWRGYVAAAGVPAPARRELLLRATGFSAARLIQSAFELSQMGPALSPQAVLLLQISANILNDPETHAVQLYGIFGDCGPSDA